MNNLIKKQTCKIRASRESLDINVLTIMMLVGLILILATGCTKANKKKEANKSVVSWKGKGRHLLFGFACDLLLKGIFPRPCQQFSYANNNVKDLWSVYKSAINKDFESLGLGFLINLVQSKTVQCLDWFKIKESIMCSIISQENYPNPFEFYWVSVTFYYADIECDIRIIMTNEGAAIYVDIILI